MLVLPDAEAGASLLAAPEVPASFSSLRHFSFSTPVIGSHLLELIAVLPLAGPPALGPDWVPALPLVPALSEAEGVLVPPDGEAEASLLGPDWVPGLPSVCPVLPVVCAKDAVERAKSAAAVAEVSTFNIIMGLLL